MTTTRSELAALLEDFARFRRAEISLDHLKAMIWAAAQTMRSPTERALRDFLERAESQLGMIQPTADAENLSPEALEVLYDLETRISRKAQCRASG